VKTCAQKLADDLGANAAHRTTAAVDTEHRELGAIAGDLHQSHTLRS
jgi:hypothetical protein